MFSIRLKESLNLEYVYEFRIDSVIQCSTYWVSHRNGEGDIWGYDWATFYAEQKKEEIDKFEEKYGYDWYEPYGEYGDVGRLYDNIKEKYNPVCNKTKDGHIYLYGESSWGILKKYPPAMDLSEFYGLVMEKAVKTVLEMKIS